jgi:hypothetical protein
VDAGRCDVIYGDGIIRGDTFCVIEHATAPATLADGNGFSHQSAFVRTALQKTYRFDVTERIAADYDLFLRLRKDGKVFRHVGVVVSEFFMGGLSSIGRKDTIRLRHRVFKKHFPRSDLVLHGRLAAHDLKLVARSLVPKGLWRRMKRVAGRNVDLGPAEATPRSQPAADGRP